MEKKTILITGGSRGIGAACAALYAQKGYQVALNYCRSRARAETLAAQLNRAGGAVFPVQADVSRAEQVASMVDKVLQKFSGIDTLLCNAGEGETGLFTDLSYARWQRLFQVNVDGVFHCCQGVLPHFLQKKCGRILIVSSMWGQVGASCEVAYSTTKAALLGFTRALAKELGPSGITVNAIAPGLIDTGMNDGLTPEDWQALEEETPLLRRGQPREVAQTAYFLSEESGSFFTGQVLAPNGGFVIG